MTIAPSEFPSTMTLRFRVPVMRSTIARAEERSRPRFKFASCAGSKSVTCTLTPLIEVVLDSSRSLVPTYRASSICLSRVRRISSKRSGTVTTTALPIRKSSTMGFVSSNKNS
ncbi:hypothetical protein Y600_5936 [Burkholderia pseudomallei MSHR3709]|nr:hypothetical protein Y600_5936 [Burkholderia pseudomallei MSHR3709]